jgi:ATP/ADP translocase
MQHWLERIFEVPAAEQRGAALALVYIFLAASACVVGRTAADTLFLARIGSDALAWMVFGSAVVVGITALIYARLAQRVSLRVLVAVTHGSLAASAVALRWLLPTHDHDIYVIAPIYILSEIQGAMSAILFATVLNEVFGRAGARGVFGVAGIGSTLAGVVFGTLMAFEAHQLHAANLLYVMAALQVLTLACVVTLRPARAHALAGDHAPAEALSSSAPKTEFRPEQPAVGKGAARKLVPRAYEKWLVVLALVQFPAILLVGYQWKVTVDATYHLSEDAMAAYFGGYYAIVNTVTLVFQIGLAGRLLKRLDPLPALVVFPAALLLAATTILLTSGGRVLLWAATVSKGSEVLRRSFGDPASQLLYQPLPQATRRRVIAKIGGGVKPIAEAVGALALVNVAYLADARDLSYLIAVLAALWMVASHRCRRLYLEAVPDEEPDGSRHPVPESGRAMRARGAG